MLGGMGRQGEGREVGRKGEGRFGEGMEEEREGRTKEGREGGMYGKRGD